MPKLVSTSNRPPCPRGIACLYRQTPAVEIPCSIDTKMLPTIEKTIHPWIKWKSNDFNGKTLGWYVKYWLRKHWKPASNEIDIKIWERNVKAFQNLYGRKAWIFIYLFDYWKISPNIREYCAICQYPSLTSDSNWDVIAFHHMEYIIHIIHSMPCIDPSICSDGNCLQ